MVPISAVAHGDLSILFVLIAVVCFAGAAYMAYLRNALGALLLVFVGVVALVVGPG